MIFCPRCDQYKAEYYGEAATGNLDLHICKACGFKFEDANLHVSPHILRNYLKPEEPDAEDESPETMAGS